MIKYHIENERVQDFYQILNTNIATYFSVVDNAEDNCISSIILNGIKMETNNPQIIIKYGFVEIFSGPYGLMKLDFHDNYAMVKDVILNINIQQDPLSAGSEYMLILDIKEI